MSIWIILSWILVIVLTVINAVVFLKLKKTSEQMLQMAFPGKNMNEALAQVQGMMQGMRGMQGGNNMAGGRPFGAPGSGKGSDAQLRAAMEMLQKMQKGGKSR
jgi:hypothetical protein